MKHISARLNWPPFTDEETDFFHKALMKDDAGFIFDNDFQNLEKIFYSLLKDVQHVGDLPIGKNVFNAIVKKTKANLKKPADIRKIPPSIFLIGLVFCARYSDIHSDILARNFWTPYVRQFWGLKKVSQAIGNQTRAHFKNVRLDFEQNLGFVFSVDSDGELVKPVYQHAIIPAYLQGWYIDWVLEHIESLLKASQSKFVLPDHLIDKTSTQSLRSFFKDKDTRETSIELTEKIIQALTYTDLSIDGEEIENLFISAIEKDIWRRINKQIFSEPKITEKLRKSAPRLQWVWDFEENELVLKLSNVRSDVNQKPDWLMILHDQSLDKPDMEIALHPGKIADGGWVLDDVYLNIEQLEDRQICIISDLFDFSNPEEDCENRVIFEHSVPPLPDMFFVEKVQSRYVAIKETVHHSGNWLVLAKEELNIIDESSVIVEKQDFIAPSWLDTTGFKHAHRLDIQLPVLIQHGEAELLLAEELTPPDMQPILQGKCSVPGLSQRIPQVFTSKEISFEFTLDPSFRMYKNIYLYLSNGKRIETIRLKDLSRTGCLAINGKHHAINLESLIKEEGNYTINLINNLEMYIPSNLFFTILPSNFSLDFKVEDTFTPNNLPEIAIKGIEGVDFLLDPSEVEVTTTNNSQHLKWKTIKNDFIEVLFSWKNQIYKLAWDIKRIAAWLENASGPQTVEAGDESNVRIELRGSSYQGFEYRIHNCNEKPMQAKLDAKGIYSELLIDTQLPEWTKSLKRQLNEIYVSFDSNSWKLFDYWYPPKIRIQDPKCIDNLLTFTIDQEEALLGDYSIYLENETGQNTIPITANCSLLTEFNQYQMTLGQGNYRIVISSYDVPIAKSKLFEVFSKVDLLITERYQKDSKEYITALLSGSYSELKSMEHKIEFGIISGAIRQIMSVNQLDEWFQYKENIKDHDDQMFKKLLPSWAVTSQPLLFTLTKHNRRWHVFPEKVLLGGKIGAGYVNLNVSGQKGTLPVYWFTHPDRTNSEAWVFQPPENHTSHFSEIDLLEMYPMYQCKTCGLLINPGSTYIHIPKSVWNTHMHGYSNLKIPFTDLVYEKHLDASISHVENIELRHTYSPSLVITQSETPPAQTKIVSFNRLIDPFSSQDFNTAINQEKAFSNPNPQNKEFITAFSNWAKHASNKIPALAAWHRLYSELIKMEGAPNFIFPIYLVAMLSRMKSRHPESFANALKTLNWKQSDLESSLGLFTQNAPLTLEWCIFWAEAFFIHAIS